MVPPDAQTPTDTCPYFWQYTHGVDVVMEDTTVANNSVACLSCSGGGVSFSSGGQYTLVNVTVTGNAAGQFGGGEWAPVCVCGGGGGWSETGVGLGRLGAL